MVNTKIPSTVSFERPLSDITSLHLILTLRCNYRCGFCFQPNFHDDLPEVVWKEKLLPVYPGLTELVLHGGEPTIVPAFVEFCDLVCSINSQATISLFTNGYRFGRYWSDLVLARGGFVNFSINAATRATYSAVNRSDNFDTVVDNVRGFRTQVRDSGSSARVDMSFVITRGNVRELDAFVRLGAELGVHRIRFFIDLGNMPDASGETLDLLQGAYAARDDAAPTQVWGLEVFEGRLFSQPVADEHLESTGCRRTFDSLYVGVNGDVSFCAFLDQHSLGNLVTEELAEIWNSPAALAQRHAQSTRDWTYCRSAYCGPTEKVPMNRAAPVLVPLSAIGSARTADEPRSSQP